MSGDRTRFRVPGRRSDWTAVATERSSLADLLDGLADSEWAVHSLCPGWRVRDVAAHLTQPLAHLWTTPCSATAGAAHRWTTGPGGRPRTAGAVTTRSNVPVTQHRPCTASQYLWLRASLRLGWRRPVRP